MKNILKHLILFISLFGLFVSLNYLNVAEEEYEMFGKINESVELKLDSHLIASDNLHTPSFKGEKTYTSQVHVTDFAFTSTIIEWDGAMPKDTDVDLTIRTQNNSGWSEWQKLEVENDHDNENSYFAMYPTNRSTSLQYKFDLSSADTSKTPEVKNIDITYVNADDVKIKEGSFAKVYSSVFYDPGVNMQKIGFQRNGVNFYTRANWGANEELRVYTEDRPESQNISTPSDYWSRFEPELELIKVVDTNNKGQDLTWPIQYPEKISKIVIHHTATTKDLEDPAKAIRDIYYWHALGKGWGDIGYNYVIDLEGNIYEGRYGGEGVVGAHAGMANRGSIGISILGNYNEDELPEKVKQSLYSLVSEKTKLHKIDPTGISYIRGYKLDNIIGHNKVMSTACPGKHINEFLQTLRNEVSKRNGNLDYNTQHAQKGNDAYVFEPWLQLDMLKMNPDRSMEFTVKLKNSGTSTWNQSTYLSFNANQFTRNAIGLYNAKMLESSVSPGQTGTFKARFSSKLKWGYFIIPITPVFNGNIKSETNVHLTTYITKPDLSYKIVKLELPKSLLKSDERVLGQVILQNTGNFTWRNYGDNRIALGTENPKDRLSSFTDESRIGYMKEREIKPGSNAHFIINLKAPRMVGLYEEFFAPVVENVGWMEDKGMKFIINVSNRNKIGVLTKNTPVPQPVTITKPAPQIDLKASILEFDLPVIVGLYDEEAPIIVEPVAENTIQDDIPVIINSDEKGPLIRIKLSEFSGIPKIVGNRFFVYQGDEKMHIALNEGGSVEYINDKYMVRVGIKAYTFREPVRFEPSPGTILEVKNFENPSSWDPSINYNKFRGVLEVRAENNELIIINELPLEDYLIGLGENTNSEPIEKIKSIMVAARTYAYYYMTQAEKFPGAPYHLSDDPDTSQKYLGYNFETRAENITLATNTTNGEMVTYKGEIVKTPYFSQSDGAILSAKDVWGWDNADYLQGFKDIYCTETERKGHGVGLNGCGARRAAELGLKYDEILKFYYKDISIKKLY